MPTRVVPAPVETLKTPPSPKPPPVPVASVGRENPDDARASVSPISDVAEKSRSFWKDPVVVIGAAVPTLILSWFFIYLMVDHAEKEFEGRAVQLKIEADRLACSGASRQAYDKYLELLAMIRGKWFGSGRYHLIGASAERSRDGLYPLVRAELEREEMRRHAQEWAASHWRPSVRQEDWLYPVLFLFVIMGKIGPILIGHLARQQPRSRKQRRR